MFGTEMWGTVILLLNTVVVVVVGRAAVVVVRGGRLVVVAGSDMLVVEAAGSVDVAEFGLFAPLLHATPSNNNPNASAATLNTQCCTARRRCRGGCGAGRARRDGPRARRASVGCSARSRRCAGSRSPTSSAPCSSRRQSGTRPNRLGTS